MFGSMQMAVSRVINLQHHRIAQVSIAFVSSSCLPHLQFVMFMPIAVSKALLCALSCARKEHSPGLKMSMSRGSLGMEMFASVHCGRS